MPVYPALDIEVQTGWRRTRPQQICQDVQTLLAVFEYDFDLSDPDFRQYAIDRGQFHRCGGGKFFDWVADHDATIQDVALALKHHPDLYADDDVTFHWRLIKMAKGSMQDLWELWCRHERD